MRKAPRRLRPGSRATSLVYLRVASSEFGTQMPKDDTLRPEAIALIKDWIDQGAEWPDELSGDPPPATPDPAAAGMIEAIRQADDPALTKLLCDRRDAVNGKDSDRSTPLLYAAMYGDAKAVRRLLDRGANPNIADDAGATPLMLGVDDAGITRLLLDRGADVNATSIERHTALSLAAGRLGAAPVVKLLLDRGAARSPRAAQQGAISPDGRWIAYVVRRAGPAPQVFVSRLSSPDSERRPVSKDGGSHPLWSRDGREIFFIGPDGVLMSAPADVGSTMRVGVPTRVLQRPYYTSARAPGAYDVSPDGRRFLMLKQVTNPNERSEPATVIVVKNWVEELRRLVPPAR